MKHMRNTDQLRQIIRIFRATRKQLGLNQTETAKIIGVEQSALSRMEHGKQIITAQQWFTLAEQAGVSADSLRWGYIESEQSAVLKENASDGLFRLPKKYARTRGSKIRASWPILEYARTRLGENGLSGYISGLKIDPDFFVNLDNQISIEFNLDMLEHLIQKGHLSAEGVEEITAPVKTARMHGGLHRDYLGKTDAGALIKVLLKNVASYECNHEYKIEDEDQRHLDISVKPYWHLDTEKYKNHPVLRDVPCRHKKAYLENFSQYNGNKQATFSEKECYHHGGSKCVYRVSW